MYIVLRAVTFLFFYGYSAFVSFRKKINTFRSVPVVDRRMETFPPLFGRFLSSRSTPRSPHRPTAPLLPPVANSPFPKAVPRSRPTGSRAPGGPRRSRPVGRKTSSAFRFPRRRPAGGSRGFRRVRFGCRVAAAAIARGGGLLAAVRHWAGGRKSRRSASVRARARRAPPTHGHSHPSDAEHTDPQPPWKQHAAERPRSPQLYSSSPPPPPPPTQTRQRPDR